DIHRTVALLHQPGPARSKIADSALAEGILEPIEGSEFRIDGCGKYAFRRPPAIGRQRVPVKGVVPDLGGIIEYAAGGLADHFLKRKVLEFGALDQVVK